MIYINEKENKKKFSTRLHPRCIRRLDKLKEHLKQDKAIIIEDLIDDLYEKIFGKDDCDEW